MVARLRGDGTGGDPLLLLSHLDVVPAAPEGWTHPPFAAQIADGYVWGRGAVDMKAMVALEVGVLRLLAARARDAGLDPAVDVVPGLRRDVLFAATADEEAGGLNGAGWLVDHRPETIRAAGALNEAGGMPIEVGGRRFYAIMVAEKGYETYRIRVRGRWSHGSMPRDDNALVRAAHVVTRIAVPSEPRPTPVVRRLLAEVGAALPPDQAALMAAIVGDDPRRSAAALRAACDPAYAAHARRAAARHVQPHDHARGHQVQRDPGRGRGAGRLPDPAGYHRGRRARGADGAHRRPDAVLRDREHHPRGARRGAGRGRAVRGDGGRDPRP